MNIDMTDALRDLGDDHGRPMPVTGRDLLGQGRQVRRRRRVTAVVGAAAVLGIAAFAVPALGLVGGQGTPMATAATVLERAAEATSDPVPGRGQYLQVTVDGMVSGSAEDAAGSVHYGATERNRMWIPADRSGVWVLERYSGAPFSFASPADEARVRKSGTSLESGIDHQRARRGQFDGGGGPVRFLTDPKLPTEPQALLRYVRKGLPPADGSLTPDQRAIAADEFTYLRVSELLVSPYSSAALRSAAFRALALISGETVVTENVAVGDKTGLAVRRTLSSQVPAPDVMDLTIVVDPATYVPLGFQMAIRGANEPVGTREYTTTVERTVVDRVPADVRKAVAESEASFSSPAEGGAPGVESR